MRFIEYQTSKNVGVATWSEGTWYGLTANHSSYPGTIQSLLDNPLALARAADVLKSMGEHIDPDTVVYLPPIGSPNKIICVGLNYHDHSTESGFKQPEYPTLFFRVSTSLTGHQQPIERRKVSDTLDFEGELAAVIGVGGKNIVRSEALKHVAGYSIFNDATIREFQFKSPQWTVGKNFDKTGAFGPWFVTSDEFPDAGIGRRLETRVNGKVVQSTMIDDMVFDLPCLIETISAAITLEVGDVIVTGTPSGVGHARKPPVYMQAGDVCEIEIEGLGVLINPIVDETAEVTPA